MKEKGQIAFIYTKGEICEFQNIEKNPNGSDYCIAGVSAYNGRVLGMMPHPERAFLKWQWAYLPNELDKLWEVSPWEKMTQNAFEYCIEHS